MHHFVYWCVAPVLSAGFGYLLWQTVKGRVELARRLGDEQAVAEVFGARYLEQAKSDRRIVRALKDKTLLSINTPILFHAIDRGYLQAITAYGLLIAIIVVLSVVLVHPGLGLLVSAMCGLTWLLPLHSISIGWVRRDLAVLAYSLLLWYDYDPEVCESANAASARFEALLGCVKRYVTEKKKHVVR